MMLLYSSMIRICRKLSFVIVQIPEFDNLYLDMNGIIHVCSHPDDFNPHFRISEDKIFEDICHYVDVSPDVMSVYLQYLSFNVYCEALHFFLFHPFAHFFFSN